MVLGGFVGGFGSFWLVPCFSNYDLKGTTDFVNFIEKTKVKKRTFLVSVDITSLYTNIPQEEGIHIVCTAFDNFDKNNPPIPTKKKYLREMLRLILKENSFQFSEDITYKPMGLLWEPRQQFLLPIFSWLKWKQIF